MLRTIKNARPGTSLQSFSILSTATPSVSATIGAGDTTVLTRVGAGVVTVGLENPYGSVAPFLALTSGVNAAAGSAACITGAQSGTTLPISNQNTSGSGVDGSVEAIAFGYRVTPQAPGMLQEVRSSKDRERLIWCKIDGATGTVQVGSPDFACTRTGTGTYSITFKRAFGRVPVISVTAAFSTAGIRNPKLVSKTAQGCVVEVRDRTPSLVDPTFIYVVVVGVDSTEETTRMHSALFGSQRKARIVAGRVTYTAGTPAITAGAGEFTIADTGTGVLTVTMTRPFAREFAVIGAARTTAKIQVNAATTASVAVLNIMSISAGTAVDPTSVDFIAIGSDDLTEY